MRCGIGHYYLITAAYTSGVCTYIRYSWNFQFRVINLWITSLIFLDALRAVFGINKSPKAIKTHDLTILKFFNSGWNFFKNFRIQFLLKLIEFQVFSCPYMIFQFATIDLSQTIIRSTEKSLVNRSRDRKLNISNKCCQKILPIQYLRDYVIH